MQTDTPRSRGGFEALARPKSRREDETTSTDKLQRAAHELIDPNWAKRRLPSGQTLAKKWPQLQYAAVPRVDL